MKSKIFFTGVFLMAAHILANGQERVDFSAPDGLTITADSYIINPSAPYVLFFHQARSSRGEYRTIAPRFLKMGLNCLAVDLRSGNEMNYITNETAARAKEQHFANGMLDALTDIKAAIQYTYAKSRQPVLLFGSSYSASLVLMEAASDSMVAGVIAFSPGEYFRGVSIKDSIVSLTKPFFVTGTKNEEKYIRAMFASSNKANGVFFSPKNGKGTHGARALWKENPNSSEYWLSLVMFVRSLHLSSSSGLTDLKQGLFVQYFKR